MFGHLKYTCCAVVLVCLLASSEPSSIDELDFESVEEAVNYAEKQLAGEADDSENSPFPGCGGGVKRPRKPSADWAAVVVSYTYSDEYRKSSEMRINAFSKNASHKLPPGIARVYFVYVDTKKIKFKLAQRGYHTIRHSFDVAQGDVRVFDDLVLERATKENGADTTGRVWLEGEGDLEGIEVRMGGAKTKTNKKGQFHLKGLAAGEMGLMGTKRGYFFPRVRVDLQRGSRKVSVLKGYLERKVRVRWAFQSDGTRNLSDDLQGGETILGNERYTRISFADGFVESRRNNDFQMMQVKDELILEQYGGSRDTGFIRLADIAFDEVLQAPSVKYDHKRASMREGDIFIFKTHGGKHYGKLEVLEIMAGNKAQERALSDLAREPLE